MKRQAEASLLDQQDTIAVVGLGFVGLPLAFTFINHGFRVVGIDVSKRKLEALRQGESYLPDVEAKDIQRALADRTLTVTDDYSHIQHVSAVIICVPTPLTPHHTPNLSYLQDAGQSIGRYLQKKQTVILESSTYPGTTREVLKPLLEKSGLKAGKDFYLAYSPERIDPGNRDYRVEEIPKVLAGLTAACSRMAQSLYEKVFDNVVMVSTPEAAELTKLLENCQRFVNISFMNEIAVICEKMNIDVWEVIAAASTKPYGFTPYYPGPGIGGHCIPVDPLYLQWKAKQYDIESRFIEGSKRINDEMPRYIVQRLKHHLTRRRKDERSFRILLYGMAYKRDLDDTRESVSLKIFERLLKEGMETSYHDPYVPEIRIGKHTFQSQALHKEMLKKQDAVVILTDHSNMPLKMILDHTPFVFDVKNVTSGWKGRPNVVRFGGGEA